MEDTEEFDMEEGTNICILYVYYIIHFTVLRPYDSINLNTGISGMWMTRIEYGQAVAIDIA